MKTAVSWLEDAVLLTREENHVRIFPSSLRVKSLVEARARLGGRKTNDTYRVKLLLRNVQSHHTIKKTEIVLGNPSQILGTSALLISCLQGIRRELVHAKVQFFFSI